MYGLKIDVTSLPPLIPLWQSENSRRRKNGVPTVAEILHSGKTAVFAMVHRGEIKVVRLSKRKTLAVTESVLEFLQKASSTGPEA